MRALALLLLPACFTPTSGVTLTELEIEPFLPTPLDILVVLDDTPAMASHLPRVPPPANVAGVLEGIYNGAPDLRIAVTTSTTGTLRTSSQVPTGVITLTMRMTDGVLVTNYGYGVDLAYALGSLMNVGAESTEPNAPLASAASALATPDFVRDESSVGILLASASDDASTDSPADYAATIQAPGNPTLVSAIYDAPADRLGAFLDAFGHRWVTPLGAYNMEAVSIFAQLFTSGPPASCFPVAATNFDECELFTTHEQNVRRLNECYGDAIFNLVPCYQMIDDASCPSGTAMLLGGGFRHYHPRIFGRCPTL